MPLLKFLKSLGKKRKRRKDKDDKERDRHDGKEKDAGVAPSAPPPSIEEKLGMVPPQIDGFAVTSPVTARLGESLTLNVDIKGIPAPIVKWFYGTKEVKPSKDFRLRDNGYQYTLHVPRVTESLGKKGICVLARNRLGEVRRRVDLKIYRVYSSRKYQALSDSETAKSPDSIIFRKKRKLKVLRPKSTSSLCSDSSGAEVERGHAGDHHNGTVDDIVYETIRSSARHVEPPRLKPRRPAIYTDSSLYETYTEFPGAISSQNVGDDVDGDIEGATAGSGATSMLKPTYQPDPDYATIEDIRRRRRSPATDRKVLTWKSLSNDLDSRRIYDDEDLTFGSIHYEPAQEDGDVSSESRHPASSASENPYGSLHITSDTPYGSLHSHNDPPYGILKRPTDVRQQEERLTTVSDPFATIKMIDDESPYGTLDRSRSGASKAGYNYKDPQQGGAKAVFCDPSALSRQRDNQYGQGRTKIGLVNGTSQSHPDPHTIPRVIFNKEDYKGYKGNRPTLYHYFDDDDIQRDVPGDPLSLPKVYYSDYDTHDNGYDTMRSTDNEYASLPRQNINDIPNAQSQRPSSEYLTYGQARQALRFGTTRATHRSPGGPYTMTRGQTRDSGYESGYMSGLTQSESPYGYVTLPARHESPYSTIHSPSPVLSHRQPMENQYGTSYTRSPVLSYRQPTENPYSMISQPAPVSTMSQASPALITPILARDMLSPQSERRIYREQFYTEMPISQSADRLGRSPSRVRQTTEILTMIKKISPKKSPPRSKSLDRDSPVRRLMDVLGSQSPRMQSILGSNYAGELICYVRQASPISWESLQSDATDLEFGFISEPVMTRLMSKDDTDNPSQTTPQRNPIISRPSDGPLITSPVTRRPPIPLSPTIIRSKSAQSTVRYPTLRQRSLSPVRRHPIVVQPYDKQPTPARVTSDTKTYTGYTISTDLTKSTSSKPIRSSLPEPPSYRTISSIRSRAVPLRPAPETKYEIKTKPVVTEAVETVTETETVIKAPKSSSTETSIVMGSPFSSITQTSIPSSSNSQITENSGTSVTTTNIDGGTREIKSTVVTSNVPGSKHTSSSSTTTIYRGGNDKSLDKEPSKMLSVTESPRTARRRREIVEKIMTETETKVEIKGGTSMEVFHGISDQILPEALGMKKEATDLNSGNPDVTQNAPVIDRSLFEAMRSTFADTERFVSQLPEQIQTMLQNVNSTSNENGHMTQMNGHVTTSTEISSEISTPDKDKEALSKLGKLEYTYDFDPELVEELMHDNNNLNAEYDSFAYPNTNCMVYDSEVDAVVAVSCSASKTKVPNEATLSHFVSKTVFCLKQDVDAVSKNTDKSVDGAELNLAAYEYADTPNSDPVIEFCNYAFDDCDEPDEAFERPKRPLWLDDPLTEEHCTEDDIKGISNYDDLESTVRQEDLGDLHVSPGLACSRDRFLQDVKNDDIDIESHNNTSTDFNTENTDERDLFEVQRQFTCSTSIFDFSNSKNPDDRYIPSVEGAGTVALCYSKNPDESKIPGVEKPAFVYLPHIHTDFELEDDVFLDETTESDFTKGHDQTVVLDGRSSTSILEDIIDISLVNDVLQFSDIGSDDLLDDAEIDELATIILSNVPESVRQEIEKDVSVKDYIKNIIQQAYTNLRDTVDNVNIPTDGNKTPENLEGTFYEMEIIEDEDDDAVIGQVSPRFLLPPRYDLDCESDQLSAITEEDDDDEDNKNDGKENHVNETNENIGSKDKEKVDEGKDTPDYDSYEDLNEQTNNSQCLAEYQDDITVDNSDITSNTDVFCEYNITGNFRYVVENVDECIDSDTSKKKDGDFSNVTSESSEEKSNDENIINSNIPEVQLFNTMKDNHKQNSNGTCTSNQIPTHRKEINCTYDIQFVPIPIESSVDPVTGSQSDTSLPRRANRNYQEHGFNIDIELEDDSSENIDSNAIYHHDYQTHAYVNGIEDSTSQENDVYPQRYYDYDDDNESDDNEDDGEMEYSMGDICDVLDFYDGYGHTKNTESDCDSSTENDATDHVHAIISSKGNDYNSKTKSKSCLSCTSKDKQHELYHDSDNISNTENETKPPSPVSHVTSLHSKYECESERTLPMKSKTFLVSSISVAKSQVERTYSKGDADCAFKNDCDRPIDNNIAQEISSGQNSSNMIFDSNIVCPKGPPVVKPIFQKVTETHEELIESFKGTKYLSNQPSMECNGSAKTEDDTQTETSFVVLKNLFRIHVPKEVLSMDEKRRFIATISPADGGVNCDDIAVHESDAMVHKDDTSMTDTESDVQLEKENKSLGATMTVTDNRKACCADATNMADFGDGVKLDSSSSSEHQMDEECDSFANHQGDENMRIIWNGYGLWEEVKKNMGSFMLLVIAVILMQIVNHWLSVEGKRDA